MAHATGVLWRLRPPVVMTVGLRAPRKALPTPCHRSRSRPSASCCSPTDRFPAPARSHRRSPKRLSTSAHCGHADETTTSTAAKKVTETRSTAPVHRSKRCLRLSVASVSMARDVARRTAESSHRGGGAALSRHEPPRRADGEGTVNSLRTTSSGSSVLLLTDANLDVVNIANVKMSTHYPMPSSA
jgi:hypothetical protein